MGFKRIDTPLQKQINQTAATQWNQQDIADRQRSIDEEFAKLQREHQQAAQHERQKRDDQILEWYASGYLIDDIPELLHPNRLPMKHIRWLWHEYKRKQNTIDVEANLQNSVDDWIKSFLNEEH